MPEIDLGALDIRLVMSWMPASDARTLWDELKATSGVDVDDEAETFETPWIPLTAGKVALLTGHRHDADLHCALFVESDDGEPASQEEAAAQEKLGNLSGLERLLGKLTGGESTRGKLNIEMDCSESAGWRCLVLPIPIEGPAALIGEGMLENVGIRYEKGLGGIELLQIMRTGKGWRVYIRVPGLVELAHPASMPLVRSACDVVLTNLFKQVEAQA